MALPIVHDSVCEACSKEFSGTKFMDPTNFVPYLECPYCDHRQSVLATKTKRQRSAELSEEMAELDRRLAEITQRAELAHAARARRVQMGIERPWGDSAKMAFGYSPNWVTKKPTPKRSERPATNKRESLAAAAGLKHACDYGLGGLTTDQFIEQRERREAFCKAFEEDLKKGN